MTEPESKVIYEFIKHYWMYRELMKISGKYDPSNTMSNDDFNKYFNRIQSIYNAYHHDTTPPIYNLNTLDKFGFDS